MNKRKNIRKYNMFLDSKTIYKECINSKITEFKQVSTSLRSHNLAFNPSKLF